MPIKLGLPTKPYWIELPHKVRLLVNPLSTAVFEAARSKAVRLAAEIIEHNAELIKTGATIGGLPDLRSEDGRQGLSQLVLGQALAQYAIIDWEGVLDEHGEPLTGAPPPAAQIDELMRNHGMFDAFLTKYTKVHDGLVVEGKDSKLSPPGTSGGGLDTAGGADKTSSPAQEESAGEAGASAPISSTGR